MGGSASPTILARSRPLDYHATRFLQHFLSGKKIENFEDVQIVSDILLKNHIFLASVCIENMLTIWRQVFDNDDITLLVENRDLIKTSSVEVNVKKRTA